MVTTIQISEDLQNELANRKMFTRETYEEVIWDLLEDTKELSIETKLEIEEARAQIRAGHFSTLEDVRKELGI
jgi:predicted CopG family antitoxin